MLNEFNFDADVSDLCENYLPEITGNHYEFDASEDAYGYLCAHINLISDNLVQVQYIGTIGAWDSSTGEEYDTNSEQWKIYCRDYLEDCLKDMKLI